jgi:hypothetical protein
VTYVAAEPRSTTTVVDSTEAGEDRSARWAAWTFAAVAAVAVPVILYQGRNQWFFADEWDFLAYRSAGSFHDLMAPHVQHWTTFGILVYRALWWLVGINHYWPYQLCLVSLHVAVAAQVRAVMRRANVNAWIATAAASLFLVFGTGRQDIVWAFQIAFTGAIAFGLAQLLLADHDGPFDRRDVIGIGFGFLALMCSAVGVGMAFAVGIATFLRRGWRIALAHTAPLAAVFLVWSVSYGRDAYGGPKGDLGSVASFVRDQFTALFKGFGQVPGVGVVLALAVVVGVPLAVSRLTWAQFRRYGGPTVGLAVAGIGLAVTSGYGRAIGGAFVMPADASRYLYVMAALLLPTVAVAVSAFVDRWRIALPIAVAIFLVGVPQNVVKLHASGAEAATVGDPDPVLTMAQLPLARAVPRDLYPFQIPGVGFPIGWLVDGVTSGRVPEATKVDPMLVAQARLRLSVYQTNDVVKATCSPMRGETQVLPGNVIKINKRGAVTFERRMEGSPPATATYYAALGTTFRIVGDPLYVIVKPTASPNAVPELCS